MNADRRLQISLLMLRLGIFVVMFIWTIDKILRPDHMASVFERYYGLSELGSAAAYIVGGAEMLLILAFVVGLWKRWTYGAVLLLHAVSTFATFGKYLTPFEAHNLLYFAAWPTLAACAALYLLRDADSLLAVQSRSPGR